MKKLYALLVTLVVTLFASNVLAYTPPPSPAPKSWISDTSGVLSPEAHARLDAKLKVINQSSANEIAALILPTLDGENIADVGDLTAKAWGVGKKDLDNGVLVVLAMKEHKSRISTGKGVEGDLPDLKSNDILVAARPYLRKGDVEGALGFIFDSSSSAIANHKAEAAAAAKTGNTSSSGSRSTSCQAAAPGSDHSGGLTLLLVVLGMSGLLWYLVRSTKRRHAEEAAREQEAREARLRLRQKQIAERETQRKLDEARAEAVRTAQQARLQREAEVKKAAPVVEPPVIRPVASPRPTITQPVVAGVSAAAGIALAAAEEEARRHRAEEAKRRREREEEESRRARERAEEDRRRRERDEEDRRRRERDEEDRRRQDSYSSSSSSSSSFDWGGSSGGGSDSGGFGGGDSGGGGSSSDW